MVTHKSTTGRGIFEFFIYLFECVPNEQALSELKLCVGGKGISNVCFSPFNPEPSEEGKKKKEKKRRRKKCPYRSKDICAPEEFRGMVPGWAFCFWFSWPPWRLGFVWTVPDFRRYLLLSKNRLEALFYACALFWRSHQPVSQFIVGFFPLLLHAMAI